MKKYKFNKAHQWVLIEDNNIVKLGISDYGQTNLGDIVHIEIFNLNLKYKKLDPIGTIESVKTVSDLIIPVTGLIIEFNIKLIDNPDLINSNPYTKGWIIRIKTNIKELNSFMSYEEYTKYIK